MPVSRPLLVALLAALLLAAAVTSLSFMRATEPPPPAPTAASTADPPAAAAARPPVAGRESRTTPETPTRRREALALDPRTAGLPRRARVALARGRTVVVMFRQRRAADDVAVGRAVRALRGTRALPVVEPLWRIGHYRPLVAGLGVAQAPATIVIGRRLRARLVEGYVDAGSLRQIVRDLGR